MYTQAAEIDQLVYLIYGLRREELTISKRAYEKKVNHEVADNAAYKERNQRPVRLAGMERFGIMAQPPEEWLTQAKYDMDTAAYMFKGGRHMYTVFMCHLSIEKALKGLYPAELGKEPPKTHNLLYLIEKMKLKLPEDLHDFISPLNRVRVLELIEAFLKLAKRGLITAPCGVPPVGVHRSITVPLLPTVTHVRLIECDLEMP